MEFDPLSGYYHLFGDDYANWYHSITNRWPRWVPTGFNNDTRMWCSYFPKKEK